MRPPHTCLQCHGHYTVPPARAARTRFCGLACRDAHGRTAERRTIQCAECGISFVTTADHGVWPKCCSQRCRLSRCVRPAEKPCAACGRLFLSGKAHHRSPDGRRTYCSPACRAAGVRRGGTIPCLQCGVGFYLSPALHAKRRDRGGCCSVACQRAYHTGAHSAGFRGGRYVAAQSDEVFVLHPRPGYSGKYLGEHRVVASACLGRPLTRHEHVIRIHRDTRNNTPENLFICASNSEFSRRRNGSLPWPTLSNLRDYDQVGLR